ncbi:tumor protein D52 isoform X1 [Cygnus atratus]|uniref:tumor protein D52 isoform X1 n=1 Tax=Cygnus atratus TaxID=8868 RepID=UPI0021B6FD55|nr:tumor protein D52 isoform X1 [Cygnus atratus]
MSTDIGLKCVSPLSSRGQLSTELHNRVCLWLYTSITASLNEYSSSLDSALCTQEDGFSGGNCICDYSGGDKVQRLLRTDSIPEVGEDAAATVGMAETLSEEEQDELRRELAKVEEEIQTLSQVLAAKEKHLAEIKRKLGINSLQELKQNITKSWQDVTSTAAYKRTSETLSQAGQKASAAFSTVGSVITKKFEDVKNSPTFKSFEEKVENLKSKVGGNKPAGGDFGEVLNSAANASATETIAEQTEEETH